MFLEGTKFENLFCKKNCLNIFENISKLLETFEIIQMVKVLVFLFLVVQFKKI